MVEPPTKRRRFFNTEPYSILTPYGHDRLRVYVDEVKSNGESNDAEISRLDCNITALENENKKLKVDRDNEKSRIEQFTKTIQQMKEEELRLAVDLEELKSIGELREAENFQLRRSIKALDNEKKNLKVDMDDEKRRTGQFTRIFQLMTEEARLSHDLDELKLDASKSRNEKLLKIVVQLTKTIKRMKEEETRLKDQVRQLGKNDSHIEIWSNGDFTVQMQCTKPDRTVVLGKDLQDVFDELDSFIDRSGDQKEALLKDFQELGRALAKVSFFKLFQTVVRRGTTTINGSRA